MLQLHDRTRRSLTLGLFFLLCVGPTLWVGAWCVRRHLPTTIRTEEERLARILGLRVALGDIAFVRPEETAYLGLEVTDPRTGRSLFTCRGVRARWRGAKQERPPQLTLIFDEPTLATVDAAQLRRLLSRLLEDCEGWPQADVAIQASTATLRQGDASSKLADLRGAVQVAREATQLQLAFRLPDLEPLPVQARWWRGRGDSPTATGFELRTGEARLPTALAASLFPPFEHLGASCLFRGTIWGAATSEGWSGQLAGELRQLDLARLVATTLPHTLTGEGHLAVRMATWRAGRITEASGLFQAGPGTIGVPLVQAAVEQLGMPGGNLPSDSLAVVPYEELALRFDLTPAGVELRGACREPGAVLVDAYAQRYGPILMEPARSPSIAALLAALATPPDHETPRVPATVAAQGLLRVLPLP